MTGLRRILIISILFLIYSCDGFCEQIHSQSVGPCEAVLEIDEKWKTIAIRFRHPRIKTCEVEKRELVDFLERSFEKFFALGLETDFESVFVGRIVEHPWIGRYLVEKSHGDPDWSEKDGRPWKENVNEFVGAILYSDEIVSVFAPSLKKAGYGIVGVSVEKVLVSSGNSPYAPEWVRTAGKVPYDAMMWLVVKPAKRTN